MKSSNGIALIFLSLPVIIGGCATAGSTTAMLDRQSSDIQLQLNSEKRKTQQLEGEKRSLDNQIAALKRQERQLQQSASPNSGQLAEIQRAIAKLETKRSSLAEIASVSR